jgi:type I restriction enzyme, S subunit
MTDLVPLRRIASIVAGQSPSGTDVQPLLVGAPFLQGNAEFGSTHPQPRLQCESPPKTCETGDLLLSVRAPVGALNWADRRYGLGRGLAAIRMGSNGDRRYMAYGLQSQMPSLHAASTGTTFSAITADDVADLLVPWATQGEQRRIADFLDDQVTRIDAVIALRGQQHDLVLDRSKSHFDELVEKLLIDLPLVPLKFLLNECDDRAGEELIAPLLAVSIHRGVVPRQAVSASGSRAENLTLYKIARCGDIVLNRMRAFQGAIGVSTMDGLVSPDYAVLRPVVDGPAGYWNVLLRSRWFTSQMTRVLRGIGSVDQGNVRTPRVNTADIGRVPMPCPTMSQMRVLAAEEECVRGNSEDFLEQLKVNMDLLKERKAALITAAVTGEFDVTTAGPRAAAAVTG